MAEKVHKHWQQFFIFYLLVGRPTLQLRDTIHVLQFIIPSSTSILKYKINQLYITQISFCLLSFFLSIYLPSFPLSIFSLYLFSLLAFLVAQSVQNSAATDKTQDQSMGQEDPLDKEMATHSRILAWDRGAQQAQRAR